jgi:kinesin family protein 22
MIEIPMQGSEDHPALLTMAMERILDCAKPIRATVSVSSYQVLQDSHVFDILEPKDSEVLVREDADGRTHLKGLSKVPYLLFFSLNYCSCLPIFSTTCFSEINHLMQVGINSIQEFQNLCYGSNKLQNPTKASNQIRGHRGFIIFISRIDQNGRECSLANMHFLELEGMYFLCVNCNLIYNLLSLI